MEILSSIPFYGSSLVLMLLLALGSFFELRERRLPNVLTLSALACGVLFSVLPNGQGLVSSLMGLGLGFSVLYAVYRVGGMGAGDVKMMAAVGALLGYPLILSVLVWTTVVGGIMSFALLLSRKELGLGVRRMGLVFQPGGASQLNETSDKLPSIPYGLAIVAGTLLTLFMGGAA